MAEENKSLLQRIREIPIIAEVREKLKNDRLKQKEKKFNKPAVLEEDYLKKKRKERSRQQIDETWKVRPQGLT